MNVHASFHYRMSRLSIEISADMHRQLKAQASLRGLSLREYVLRQLESRTDVDSGESRPRFSESGLAGIWSDRDDMQDPDTWLRRQRRPRSFGGPVDGD